MFETMENLPAGVLGFRATGEVTASDYTDVLKPALDAVLQRGDDVRIVIEFPEWSGMSGGAMWEDLKMGVERFTKWKRIALVTELSLQHGIADGPLCLALVSRREHAREWVAAASTRSLPARRLAAKILERAAREAATRAQMGDTHALRAFMQENVRGAYNRLLSDRESLVWRYVAVARGLCAGWVPELREQISESLKEGLSPTEWRRAATSSAGATRCSVARVASSSTTPLPGADP